VRGWVSVDGVVFCVVDVGVVVVEVVVGVVDVVGADGEAVAAPTVGFVIWGVMCVGCNARGGVFIALMLPGTWPLFFQNVLPAGFGVTVAIADFLRISEL
jgi:hypothetical protein